jgi:hypothetical protein
MTASSPVGTSCSRYTTFLGIRGMKLDATPVGASCTGTTTPTGTDTPTQATTFCCLD